MSITQARMHDLLCAAEAFRDHLNDLTAQSRDRFALAQQGFLTWEAAMNEVTMLLSLPPFNVATHAQVIAAERIHYKLTVKHNQRHRINQARRRGDAAGIDRGQAERLAAESTRQYSHLPGQAELHRRSGGIPGYQPLAGSSPISTPHFALPPVHSPGPGHSPAIIRSPRLIKSHSDPNIIRHITPDPPDDPFEEDLTGAHEPSEAIRAQMINDPTITLTRPIPPGQSELQGQPEDVPPTRPIGDPIVMPDGSVFQFGKSTLTPEQIAQIEAQAIRDAASFADKSESDP